MINYFSELTPDPRPTPLEKLIGREELAKHEFDLLRMQLALDELPLADRELLYRRIVDEEALKAISISLVVKEASRNALLRREASCSARLLRTAAIADGEVAARVRANIAFSSEARRASQFEDFLFQELLLHITHKPAETRINKILRPLRKSLGVVIDKQGKRKTRLKKEEAREEIIEPSFP
jgi:hypothetical protein